MNVRYFAGAAVSALLFATQPQAAVTTYATRAAFDAANPGLVLEDFEAAAVDSDDVGAFTGPLNSATSNAVFGAGDVAAGFSLSTTTAAGAPGSNDIYVGNGFGGVPTKVVSSNLFSENILLTFAPGITAFGVDLSGFFDAVGPWNVTLRSAGGDEGVFALPTGGFFGASSTVALTGVYLDKPDTGGTIDNLAFGAAGEEPGIIPEPGTWGLMILGFGLAGAMLRRRGVVAA